MHLFDHTLARTNGEAYPLKRLRGRIAATLVGALVVQLGHAVDARPV